MQPVNETTTRLTLSLLLLVFIYFIYFTYLSTNLLTEINRVGLGTRK